MKKRQQSGMTLMELLIVISIIAILSALALPGLKGMRQSNVINSATRQLLDDFALARQLAIKNRSEVCVLFAPPISNRPPRLNRDQLILGQCTAYRLYAKRTVGDQPGASSVRYLTQWKELPEGVYIAPEKFDPPTGLILPPGIQPFRRETIIKNWFPHPSSTNDLDADRVDLRFVCFDSQGRLASQDRNEYGQCIIPLTRGAVTFVRDANGGLTWGGASFEERPIGNWSSSNSFNFIVIDGLTGRARVKRPEIQ